MKLCPLLSNHKQLLCAVEKTEYTIKQILLHDYICGRGKDTDPKADLSMTKKISRHH